jgi:hypothetical protein
VSPVKYEQGFYILEDDILHSHRHGNLKSYITFTLMIETELSSETWVTIYQAVCRDLPRTVWSRVVRMFGALRSVTSLLPYCAHVCRAEDRWWRRQ